MTFKHRHGNAELGGIALLVDVLEHGPASLAALQAAAALRNLASDGGFVPRPAWRALTRFERRGHRLGHGVWDLSFERA